MERATPGNMRGFGLIGALMALAGTHNSLLKDGHLPPSNKSSYSGRSVHRMTNARNAAHNFRQDVTHRAKVQEDQARGLESRNKRKALYLGKALYPYQKNHPSKIGS